MFLSVGFHLPAFWVTGAFSLLSITIQAFHTSVNISQLLGSIHGPQQLLPGLGKGPIH